MEKRVAVALGLLVFAGALTTQANSVTNLNTGEYVDLASYLGPSGGAILIGDKLFDDFTYVTSDSTGLTNNLLPAGAISLGALSNSVGFGLSFNAPFFTAQNIQKDFVITYSVTVTNAPLLISDVHLDYNGAFVGNGFSIVTETVFDAGGIGGNLLGQINVHNPPPLMSTNLFLNPAQPKLFIQKDIQLLSFSNNDIATISVVNQVFSQIPEPSTITLAAGGLAGLWHWHRRRRQC